MEKQPKRSLSKDLEAIVSEAIKNDVFSACSVGGLGFVNDKVYHWTRHYGYTDRNERGARVTGRTVYDLASLTKPLVTTLALMALVEQEKVRLEDEMGSFFSGMSEKAARIRLGMLLSHSSGLPAHRPYHLSLSACHPNERKKAIIQLIGQENIVFPPGSGTLYSDLGFILLGLLVEELSGRSLADFWRDEIAYPMGLQEELFFPGPEGLGSDLCAVTGVCSWSKRRLCGLVHDDNCRMLGGVAGHAGLFGTAAGVLSLAGHLLLQYRGKNIHPAYTGSTLKKFLTRRQASNWTYGFDTPSSEASSSGKFFSPGTVGHLGFTGTSFWLDLDQGVGIVLLTNRVLMGDDSTAIRIFRPLLHNTIMEHLLEKRRPDWPLDSQSGLT